MARKELKDQFRKLLAELGWDRVDSYKRDEWDDGFDVGKHSCDDEIEWLEAEIKSVENNAYARGYENGLQAGKNDS